MSADLDHSWDKELTTAEVFRLSPGAKRERTTTSFRRKVELLRRSIEDPLLLMALAPEMYKSRAALRRWEMPEHGFWKWSDPTVDDEEGPNAVLVRQWVTLIEAIDVLRKGKNHQLKQELEAQKLINANLEAQVVALTDQIGMLHRKLQEKREARV